jgi:hypothetical protein
MGDELALAPGCSAPTLLIPGQSVCVGCGFELGTCVTPSLFTNRTTSPDWILTCWGLTPEAVIVTVAPMFGVPLGPVGLPPASSLLVPQAANPAQNAATATMRLLRVIENPPLLL